MRIKANFLVGVLMTCLASGFLFGQDASDLARFQRFFQSGHQAAPERSLSAATLRLEQAREIQDGEAIATALKDVGLIHFNTLHNYEKAMDLFVQALAIEDSLALEAQRALTYVAIARIFEVVGDYYKSAQFLGQALKLNEEGRDINAQAMILTDLGKVNASMGKLDDALAYYERVLQFREDIDRHFEADALFNLAHLYTLRNDYTEALRLHKEALRTIRSVGDRATEALYLNDIGILYRLMRNESKSLANHQAALEIREELNDRTGMAESCNNLAAWHFRQNQLDKALSTATLALAYGQDAQSQEQMFKSYELLSQCYKQTGDFERSLRHKELALAMSEFMQNEREERHLLETQNRYVLEKKEQQIEQLEAVRADREKQIAAQKKFRNILYILVGMMLIIALLIFYLYLVKRRSHRILRAAKVEVQRQNATLQELNSTKDKFFSIISHDLKGPLNSLTSFSHLLIDHTDSMSREEIQMLARDLDKSVKNLSVLLENLLDWSRSQTGNIDFSPELFDLSEMLESNRSLLERQAANKQISIRLASEGVCQVKLHKASVNTVVRNLLSNAIKFTPAGGMITIGAKRSADSIDVFVADNGLGISKEVMAKLFRIDRKHSTRGTANEKGTGLGLILCREFVEKNGGRISVNSDLGKGSVFSFSFPLSVCAPPAKNSVSPATFF